MSTNPQASASVVRKRPAGIGRFRVRSMRASVRRSINMFSALAPAATRPVPIRTATRPARRTWAADPITKPTIVVSWTIKVMRGLVSSR